ncbi:hypothetical protein CEUSTIGMA_g10869.t1 [Chlamydomonas eustigma]|uniref:C2H2-type domain-containing protein n=1 Tax=Chlamydomonas eustigma TaxID=1157962 RepID=A0A250XK44_9CHLO|nr:hypothetical protein CEUSTIGMA_g10869.t1 [Chlamydomonas eustigma]|eukprot:GAX83444.1 hypothetical protein CEUSTIGMA_g10869.t1 [Chlamydomonas eustigma]
MPPGKRAVGSSHKQGKKPNKQHLRSKFESRHIDQVWEDIRKGPGQVHESGKSGPRGTTSKVELDEDVPGYGKFYCIACSRYFQSATAQADHDATKPHKRRVKMLMTTARPHNQRDADTAGGLGTADNGPKLRSADQMMVL